MISGPRSGLLGGLICILRSLQRASGSVIISERIGSGVRIFLAWFGIFLAFVAAISGRILVMILAIAVAFLTANQAFVSHLLCCQTVSGLAGVRGAGHRSHAVGVRYELVAIGRDHVSSVACRAR